MNHYKDLDDILNLDKKEKKKKRIKNEKNKMI